MSVENRYAESYNVCFYCQSQMESWNLFPQWQVRGFCYGSRALARGTVASGAVPAEAKRCELKKIVKPLLSPPGFTGRAGGPSRWSIRRSAEWQPLKPKLVCEVQYDHFSGGRFRLCAGVRRRSRDSAHSSR
jgi:ATP-dependent DNA ligase